MKITNLKYTVPLSVLAVSAFAFTAPVSAMDFKVSGQVDRAAILANNGEDSDVGFVDNSGSSSRFRFTGKQTMNDGLMAGFTYEIGLDTNRSKDWDINSTQDVNAANLDTRKIEAWLRGAFGRVSLGKGSVASDGTSSVDYSGTYGLGGGAKVHAYAGGVSFLDAAGDRILDADGNAVRIKDVMDRFNSLERRNRVRYDSPSIGGVVLSTSLFEGHAYDLAARYETKFGDGGKFGLAADWLDTESYKSDIDPDGHRNSSARFQEYGGSASLLLPSGLNFTGVYKHRETVSDNALDADFWFAGVGYIIDRHHFQLNWARNDDLLNQGSKATQYGVAYVFDWTGSVQLYASYHQYQLQGATATSVDGQNINVVYLGTRIKFL